MVDKTRMGKLHEDFIASSFGGSATKGSGNQWSNPNDTRDNHHVVPFALSFQCKSTAGASLSVSRETVFKTVEEAGGELPALALRWYPNERLDHLGINDDWAALRTADLDEILAAARERDALRDEQVQDTRDYAGELRHLKGVADELRAELMAAQDRLREIDQSGDNSFITPPGQLIIKVSDDWTEEEIHQFSLDIEAEMARRRTIVRVEQDTTIVYAFRTGTEPERMRFQGVRISPYGVRQEFSVRTVRVERSIDNKPRLMVNDCLINRGEYWLDGIIQCRTYEPVLG